MEAIYIRYNSPNQNAQLCKSHTWKNVIKMVPFLDGMPIWSLLWNVIQSEANMAWANILKIHLIPQPKPWFIAPIPKALGRLYVGSHGTGCFSGSKWGHADSLWHCPLERQDQNSSESPQTVFSLFPVGPCWTIYPSGLIDNILF